ncbi:MAG: T9SS type A sorting domain-containing protein [Bacteroidetes bacterium]|nr:T9SS type A sorting domain-containing protein [Bacteroidota bacterium]MBL7103072.1 T9SS type A sorting domain-containing protein [Bacteroidales bacterium]
MKKLTLITAILITANLLFAQYNKIDTSFYSEALNDTMLDDVYFPPGYDDNPDWYYPVIYYLHGWTDDQNSLSEMLSTTQTLINNGTIDPLIMVCADNSPDPFYGSWYVNSIIWGNYEEYMVNDLVTWVESSFRAMPHRNWRSLLGQSMGGYGSFRYGILHKDKFRVLAAHATAPINMRDPYYMDETRQVILQENQPGPSYFYDFYSTGIYTQGAFAICGAFTPDTNSPQTYINPQIVEFCLDENGNYIDTVLAKADTHNIAHLIHQLSSSDSVGIYFGCGSNDALFLYPAHLAMKDTLDALNLPYEFYSHNGGHSMPFAFKQRALIFIDSLLMSPDSNTTIIPISESKDLFNLKNYPNPFNNNITIQFELTESSSIELSIWNHLGQQVGLLFTGNKRAGRHQVIFDASTLPDGIFFCQLRVGNKMVTKKIIKVK